MSSVRAVLAQGTLNGIVTDAQGEPLYGVVVRTVENATLGALSDFDGLFVLKFPDDKKYTLSFDLMSYEQLVDSISVKKGEVITKEFTLLERSFTSGEVVVVAKASKAADSYMDKIKMNSAVTLDYISSETMKKTGDSNVINAIARVSGVSTNGGLITVRGIGDRYVRTTLNGSRIPTLDPLTNNIKLDIFPASLIDNIVITKTASPDLPGDWCGAYISVETKDFPEKLSVNIDTQFGYNAQTTGKDFLTSERSSTDWLGFDGGFRTRSTSQVDAPNLAPGTYQEFEALGLGNYFSQLGIHGWVDGSAQSDEYFRLGLIQLGLLPASLKDDPTAYQNARNAYNAEFKPKAFNTINPNGTDYNNGFSNNWNTKFRKAPLSFSQSFSIGDQQLLFGKQLGYFFGFRYANTFRYDPDGISQRVGDATLNYPFDRQDIAQLSREINSWSALLNLAYKLNENNKVSLLFMPNFIGSNEVANYTSLRLPEEFQDIDVSKNIFYEQRKQLIYQISSQHFLPKYRLKIDFNTSYTSGESVAPDFKATQYFYTMRFDTIQSYQFSPAAGDGIRRYYRYLDENILDSRLNFELPLSNKNTEKKDLRKLKFGLATQRNYRKMDNDEYRVMLGNNPFLDPLLNDDLDSYMSPERFIIRDGISDFTYQSFDYDRNHSFGHSNVEAAFIMTDFEFNPSVRFAGGVRLEHTDIFTDADKYDRLGYARNDPRRENVGGFPLVNAAIIDEWNLLPSASLIYKLEGEKYGRTNLRFNYSQSIARPSIRELSDAALFDNEFRTLIYGNSDLKMAEISNYDFRAETFFENKDNVSVSLFYKDFTNHIEMGFGSSGITWGNVANSNVMGIEFEGRKKLGNSMELRANVTLVKSEAEFIRQDFQVVEGIKVFTVVDTIQRPMFGQAPYLINAIFSYRSDTLGLTATASYNVQGPRLVIAGAVRGRADVYELPRNTLDVKVSKTVGKHFTVNLTLRDILNAPVRRSYKLPDGWVDYDRFQYGTNYLFGLTYKL
jgi:hypothetical protein